jgi:hypothetical protein
LLLFAGIIKLQNGDQNGDFLKVCCGQFYPKTTFELPFYPKKLFIMFYIKFDIIGLAELLAKLKDAGSNPQNRSARTIEIGVASLSRIETERAA